SVTRRMSVTLSASGEGFRPSFWSRARMNASMGLRTAEPGERISGTDGRLMGWNAQWADFADPLPSAFSPAGTAAPESIHRRSAAASASLGPGPFGGILATSFDPDSARISRLSADFPGTMAGPE